MCAVIAVILFIIAAILEWPGKSHADAIAYAGLAFLALQGVIGWHGRRVTSA